MFSVIVHATGEPDLLFETIRRLTCGASVDREVVVVGAVGDVPARIGPGGRDDAVVWIDRRGIGRADAVNERLARTRGAIVSTYSARDFHFEDTLRIVAEAAARHPSTDCFYGDAMLTDAAGRPFAEFNAPARSKRRRGHHLRLCPASVFLRREAIGRVGPLDPSVRHWADYELWLRLERARVIPANPPAARGPTHGAGRTGAE